MSTERETVITVADGKYEIRHADGRGLRALRYGEPWRDLAGDNLVLALVQRIEELQAAREKAEPVCAVCDGPNTYDRASGVCRECQDVAEHDTHPTAPAEAESGDGSRSR